jgi:hypothetical protein
MKRAFFIFMVACFFSVEGAFGVTIPEPPDLSEIYALITRPAGNCDGTQYYLKAEKLLFSGEMKGPYLDEKGKPYQLMLEFLKCGKFVLPYSLEMKLPPVWQRNPSSLLLRGAAKTFRKKGDEALDAKHFDAAYDWYSKAVNIGLHVREEPGITIIQDTISMMCIGEGVEGLGDLYIAKGDVKKAAACARFLSNKTAYLDQTQNFLSRILGFNESSGRGFLEPKATPEYREIVRQYPRIKHLPIKMEVLYATAVIHVFSDERETRAICMKVIKAAKRDSDPRFRKVAAWAETWSKEKIFEESVRYGSVEWANNSLPKEELKQMMDKYGPEPGWWKILPEKEIMERLRKRLGLKEAEK